MTKFTASYKSCEADVIVEKDEFGKKICSIISIFSKEEGKGHATFLINRLEGLAKQRRCNEIWYPTVMNKKLALKLAKLGYIFKNLGRHEEGNYEVDGWVKELRK